MSAAKATASVRDFDLRLLIFDFVFWNGDAAGGFAKMKSKIKNLKLINLKDEGPALKRSL
jgi:hypothetical protein